MLRDPRDPPPPAAAGGHRRGPARSQLSRRAFLAAAAIAGRIRAEMPLAPAALRLVIREGDLRREVEGRLVVEAADGGVLLELADQRYRIVQPEAIESREPLAALTGAATPRELGERILAELPAGFDLHLSRNYITCFATSRDYARWAAALFERLHDGFANYWAKAGVEVSAPRHPLIVVIFGTRAAYEPHAVADLGAAADRVVGYYNLLSNRIATYDLTASEDEAASAPRGRRTAEEILSRPEAASLVATLVHEATHQMAFNCGLHARLAPVPVWVSEGIATVFETPDLKSRSGWRGIGAVNRHRLERFRGGYRPGDLAAVLDSDDRFRDPATAVDAYAVAWALTWFLLETRRPRFVAYQRGLARKVPLEPDDPVGRRAAFVEAIGAGPDELEPALLRYMARLDLRRP